MCSSDLTQMAADNRISGCIFTHIILPPVLLCCAGLTSLTAFVFTGITDTLAFVRFRLSPSADFSRNLANLFLIAARYHDNNRRRGCNCNMRKNATRNAVIRRHLRLRKKISGTAACPRLNVFRSLGNIYAQVIDDEAGVTLVSANTLDKEIKAEFPYGGNVDAAKAVGVLVGKRALEKGIETVVFDRGGYIYHGRVQALAEGAREAGLKF